MADQVRDILQRLVHGEDVSQQELLWGALLVGMLFATVHLLTMMVTRWGDHKATSKSLIFSIMLHLSCGFGLVAVNPPPRPEPPEKPKVEDDAAPFRIVEVRLDGAETFETDVAGNTPQFEKLPPPDQVVMTRREMLPFDPDPLPEPDRIEKKVTPHEISDPNLPALPDEQIAAPSPQKDAPKTGPTRIASIPDRTFDKTAQRRPEIRNPTPINDRVKIPRPAQSNQPIVRETTLGSAEKTEPMTNLNITAGRTDPLPKPDSLFRSGQPRPFEQLRKAPTRTPHIADNAGDTARRVTKGTAGTNPQPKRLAGLRTSPIENVPNGGLDRFKPTVTPTAPSPKSNRLAMRNVPTVDSLRSGPRPNVLRTTGPITKRRIKDIPATYRLRSLANRKAVAEKYGGTDASEQAVEDALKWLAANQHADGYWDAGAHGAGKVGVDEKGVNRRHAGLHADTGLTALALLAFLGAGYTHEEGPYARTVDKALTWLVSQQRADGFLGGKASHYARMYCHGMATYAIAEAYGMQSDPTVDTRLRAPLQKAVGYILDNQNPKDGGWRYLKGQISDMSMFGWQLMALKSAEIAGVRVPDSAKRGMIQFLKDHSFGPKKGLAAYQKSYPVSETMTAEALFCKQMFRIPREHPASKEAVSYLMARMPRQSKLNLYYWYYGTLAMYQYGGPEWKRWNDAMWSSLKGMQIKTGPNAGSWDPKGPWGPYGGRVFSTAMSAMCLEVYYRFLPLYKVSGRPDEKP